MGKTSEPIVLCPWPSTRRLMAAFSKVQNWGIRALYSHIEGQVILWLIHIQIHVPYKHAEI